MKRFMTMTLLTIGFFMTSTIWAYVMMVILKKLRYI